MTLPSTAIKVFFRSDESGPTENFQKYRADYDAATVVLSALGLLKPGVSYYETTKAFGAAGVPVVELGLTNDTIHQIGECVRIDELDTLTRIYADIITHFEVPA